MDREITFRKIQRKLNVSDGSIRRIIPKLIRAGILHKQGEGEKYRIKKEFLTNECVKFVKLYTKV